MTEDASLELSKPAGYYPLLSVLLLFSIPVSCIASYFIFGNYTWLNAFALLIVPFAIFCWIFTTIRAIHLADIWFWSIPSTYVTLISGLTSLIISGIMLFFSQEVARRGHSVADTTLYFVAAILFSGCVFWSYLYNWRRTHSTTLAISLTVLQMLSAIFVIGVINLWLDGRNTRRYNRDHGIQ